MVRLSLTGTNYRLEHPPSHSWKLTLKFKNLSTKNFFIFNKSALEGKSEQNHHLVSESFFLSSFVIIIWGLKGKFNFLAYPPYNNNFLKEN
jgi:hypothetical protein